MPFLQGHFGMLPERLASRCVLVLRADGQHHAALPQIEGEVLDGDEGLARRRSLAERDAVNSVIADDAAPQRVVEIKDENLLRLAHERPHDAGDHVGVNGSELRREGKL